MSNMSYCRFENTADDLFDCLEHIEDDLGQIEHEARRRLINHCREIVKAADEDERLETAYPWL